MVEALIGVIGAALVGWLLYWKQRTDAGSANRAAYLRHLQEELQANRQLIASIKFLVEGGPVIQEILTPAEVASRHLRFTAWDALVRAGVLAQLQPADQRLLATADQGGRKVAQDIQIIAANWRRALDWQRWTETAQAEGELVQGVPLRSLLRQMQGDIAEALLRSLERTDAALDRLTQLLPKDAEDCSS